MAKIVPEIEFMLATPSWLKQRAGEDVQIFGPLLGWTTMTAGLSDFPGDPAERVGLAAICAHTTTLQHLLGFCAGLAVMEKLGIRVPARGRPGFVGAGIESEAVVIEEAKDCWDRSKDHFAGIAEELDAYDQEAREAIVALLQELEIRSDLHDRILDVSVGFEMPAKARTPTRAGFVWAFAWKRYVEDPAAAVSAANRREFALLGSYLRVQASLRGQEPPEMSVPNPFPRDFRCLCGDSLDRYLFCCDPSRVHSRASLVEVDEHFQLEPCERCGETLFGFNCDGCGAAHCWIFGVVDSHGRGS